MLFEAAPSSRRICRGSSGPQIGPSIYSVQKLSIWEIVQLVLIAAVLTEYPLAPWLVEGLWSASNCLLQLASSKVTPGPSLHWP